MVNLGKYTSPKDPKVDILSGTLPQITQGARSSRRESPAPQNWRHPRKSERPAGHDFMTHRIHVWYIYLHLVDFYGKCRPIYHIIMDGKGDIILRRFQQTLRTYLGGSPQTFEEDFFPFIDRWFFEGLGYVPGICWSFLRIIEET